MRTIATVFLLVAFGWAQNASTPKVLISLLVRDSHNRPIGGLNATSLVIRDQKKSVVDFTLTPAADLPLELGILIDTSASQRGTPLPEALKAAKEFVNTVVRAGNDRAFFLTFSDKPAATKWLKNEDLTGFSIDVAYGRGTALYDSIVVACQQRFGLPDRQHPSRRVLVVISDGEDNFSHMPRTLAESEALKSGVLIFSVSTQESPMRENPRGTKALERIAADTGGQSFTGLSRSDMPKVFAAMQQFIDGMYYASYVPPDSTNVVHDVEVKPAAKEKFKVSYPEKYAWLP